MSFPVNCSVCDVEFDAEGEPDREYLELSRFEGRATRHNTRVFCSIRCVREEFSTGDER